MRTRRARTSISSGPTTPPTATTRRTSPCGWPARAAGRRARSPQSSSRGALELPEVERAEVAGPGFVNLWLGPTWYGEALAELLAAGDRYGGGSAATHERIQVEMVSANPTGPIVVSAARNGAYGDSVARLLDFAGHEVEREYYYNDAGAQMERFRASVEAAGAGRSRPGRLPGRLRRRARAAPGDPVPQMLHRMEATLERFRIHFDCWAKQSELEQRLPDFLPRLDTYEKDGAVWARSSAYGDENDRVLIRSETGMPTYCAADVVYLADKFDRGLDRAVYVLGADHHGTRNWYAAVARMLGYDPERVEVLLYQLVHLTRGGAATKMSKRRGDVVFARRVPRRDRRRRGALVPRQSRATTSRSRSTSTSRPRRAQKNPVYYVQYAHARIAGILRNAGDARPDPSPPAQLAREESDLVKRLREFPGVVAEATERRGPHAIPNYAIRVADDFHRFYHHHKVLGSDSEGFRLGARAPRRRS